ncbi:MAG TPA: NADP-dependent malic enzyme [Anaerolineae bacterium]|nr:NADP-dependent malic enzyme [Anaerolineae bacterium]
MLKEQKKFDVAELLAKANKPSAAALQLHPYYRGKIETTLKCCVRDINDFAIWYTPGVAAPSRDIALNPERVYDYTNKWNSVAVISDGSHVLGLGNIGPKAALPVMEGKILLYKYLGGVDGFPICLDTKDPDKFIETVLLLQPSFGGINLEDIAQPKCFRILDTLRAEAEIPIWHDDQQGTATVILAALMNALKVVGKNKEEVKIAFVGCGAANVACTRLAFAWGIDPAKAIMVDSLGILGKHRADLYIRRHEFVDKWRLCETTNAQEHRGGIAEAMRGADVVVAFSGSGPGTILPEWVKHMAKDAIVFACANPVPEIWPWEATEAGAAIVATGRSDFPNQVNNSLGFPGIFRGVLDVRASTITDEMCFAAAEALAQHVGDKLSFDYILPTMDDGTVFAHVAAVVGSKAVEQGLARLTLSYQDLLNNATRMIKRSQDLTRMMMDEAFIAPYPAEYR